MRIGAMELVVVLLIAFLVLGPEKTVAYARKLGRGLRTLKVYVNSFTEDIKETVTEPLAELAEPLNELTGPLNELAEPLEDVKQAVQQPVDELRTSIKATQAELKAPLRARTKRAAAKGPAAIEELEEAVPVEPDDR